MGINEVAERFKLLSGVDEEELLKWMPLINEAVIYINGLLREDVQVEKYSALLSSAAGAYAYYKWSLYNQPGDMKSFKAGDISITENRTSATQDNSKILWEHSLKEILHLTRDNSFFFEGVQI